MRICRKIPLEDLVFLDSFHQIRGLIAFENQSIEYPLFTRKLPKLNRRWKRLVPKHDAVFLQRYRPAIKSIHLFFHTDCPFDANPEQNLKFRDMDFIQRYEYDFRKVSEFLREKVTKLTIPDFLPVYKVITPTDVMVFLKTKFPNVCEMNLQIEERRNLHSLANSTILGYLESIKCSGKFEIKSFSYPDNSSKWMTLSEESYVPSGDLCFKPDRTLSWFHEKLQAMLFVFLLSFTKLDNLELDPFYLEMHDTVPSNTFDIFVDTRSNINYDQLLFDVLSVVKLMKSIPTITNLTIGNSNSNVRSEIPVEFFQTLSDCLPNRLITLEVYNLSMNCITPISDFHEIVFKIMKSIRKIEINYLALPRSNNGPFYLNDQSSITEVFSTISDFSTRLEELLVTCRLKCYKILLTS